MVTNLVIWGNGSDDLIRTWDTKKENLKRPADKGSSIESYCLCEVDRFLCPRKTKFKKPQILKKKKNICNNTSVFRKETIYVGVKVHGKNKKKKGIV